MKFFLIYWKIVVIISFVKFKFTVIISLKWVRNIREKFDLIQILIEYSIMFTERIALFIAIFN